MVRFSILILKDKRKLVMKFTQEYHECVAIEVRQTILI